MQRTSSRWSWLGVLTGLLLVVLSVWVVANRQQIVDQLQAYQYQPTPAIAALAERTTMTDTGKMYFYTSHPSLESAETFNTHCDRKEAGSAVLGCYANGRIYLYDIQNEELGGIKEVTAAHEMLHAAFDRLKDEERSRVGTLLEAAYERHDDNPELAERMEFYARTQPDDRITELHSILGTEATELGSELESYYARYFTNRLAVVDLYDGYASRFQELNDRREALGAELEALRQTIEARTGEHNAAIERLNGDIEAFNDRARRGEFSSQAAFIRERQVLVGRIASVDAMRDEINRTIAQYDTKRQEYNTVADDTQRLYESIDSSLAPSPSIGE